MPEGFNQFETLAPPEKIVPNVEGPDPIERIVAQRWETLNEQLSEFEEAQAEDVLNPKRFMEEEVEAWEAQHEESETIDIMSPFERVRFLLALLIEQGAEWPTQKRAAVRRALYGFTEQSFGAMQLTDQQTLNRTILASSQDKIGRPKPNEQKLIDK